MIPRGTVADISGPLETGPVSRLQQNTVAKGTYIVPVVANDGKVLQTQSVTLVVN